MMVRQRPNNDDQMVACRFLGWLFDVCRDYDITMADALEGIPFSERHINKKSNYIDWDSFCRLVANISSYLTHEQIIDVGRDSFRSPIFRTYAVLGRLLFNPQPLYRWIAIEILPRLYPIKTDILHYSSYKLHLRLSINQGLPPCPTLLLAFEGQFATLSSLIGYRQSDVKAIHRIGESEYIISFSKRRTFWGAVIRMIRKPLDQRTSVLELRNAQIDLLKKSRELELENRRIDEAHFEISGLEQQRELLEQTIVDMIWLTDLEDRFLYVSPAIRSMFGYEVAEALRMNFYDLVSSIRDENLFSVLKAETEAEKLKNSALHTTTRHQGEVSQQVAGAKRSRVFELLVRRKDGSEFWCEVHRSFHYDKDGRLSGLAGVTRDITERKQNESEKALLEQELSHSRHMESIGQLAGGIAHDFNNMLTTVLGFSDLARDGVGPEHPISPYLDEISRAGGRASDLVRQLLTFSKQQPMAPQPLDLNDLVANLEPMLKRLIAENIELVIDCQSIPVILGDVAELERVIINLCINANDAMPDGGSLMISTREYLLSGDDNRAQKAGTDSFACISVSDTGLGIEPELQQKVLEPFFTTKPFGQGTGLGLAVTYSIVQQHRGFLDLVSHPQRGTTIKVFLPRTENTIVPSLDETNEIELLQNGTVLVVEDQDQVRRLLVQILQSAGFNVVEAKNGVEAVSAFERFSSQIDMVLMDIVMPKMGGRDALALIREIKPDAKVLFMTGYSGLDPKIDFAAASGYPVLRKPFSTADVIRRVGEMINPSW